MKFIDSVNSKIVPQLPDVDKIFPKHGTSSFSNVLSSEISALSILPKTSAPAASDKASAKSGIQPGIVNFPAASAHPYKPENQPINKQAGKIDIARILDFVRPASAPAAESAPEGSVDLIAGNPSVAIGNRPPAQGISERCMESFNAQKGGPLSNGVMVSFRIKIG